MAGQQHEIRIRALYEDLMTQGLIKSDKTIDAFGKQAKKSGKEVETFGKKASNIAKKPLSSLNRMLKSTTLRFIGVGVAIATISKGVKVFIDTEKALAEVATISPEVAANIDGIGDAVGDLAIRFGVAEAEVSKGLYQTISAGISEPIAALETLETALSLAIAGLADTTATTDLLVGTMNAFGLAGEDAARVADIMFATVKRGKTTIGDLAQSMSMVTPVAAALGVSLEEVNAAVATITLSGAPTAIAVTQVSAALSGLLKKSGDIDEALRGVNSSGKGFDLMRLRTEGLIPILEDLRQTYTGNEEALTELLGRKEAMLAVFGLTGDKAAVFNDILIDVTNSTGAMDAALQRMGQTMGIKLSAVMEGVRQGLGELGRALVEGLLGEKGMKAGLDDSEAAALRVKQVFTDFIPVLKGIGVLVTEIGEGISFWATMGDAAENMAIIKSLKLVRERMDDLNEAPRDIIALTGAIAAWKIYLDQLKEFGDPMGASGMAERRIKALNSELDRAFGDAPVANGPSDALTNVSDSADAARVSMLALNAVIIEHNLAMLEAARIGLSVAMGMVPTSGSDDSAPAVPGSQVGGGVFTGPSGPDVPIPLPDPPQIPQAAAPSGAAAAWKKLHDQMAATDKLAEDFTNRAIRDFGSGLTDAFMSAASGAKSVEDAFANFAASFLADIARMIVQQQIFNALAMFGTPSIAKPGDASFIGPVDGLASGGVVHGGLLPVKGYADGGPIITKPHIALVGEGRHNEAVVPLPGGVELPVILRGSGGSTMIEINLTTMDGMDAERVLVRSKDTIRAIIQDALMTDQGFRTAIQGGRG